MKAVRGKRFAKIMELQGREVKRITGSHHIYVKAGNPLRLSIPVHGNNPLKIGLQKHLMKVADIEESEL